MNQSVVDINLASNEGPNKNLLGKYGAEIVASYMKTQNVNCVLNFLNLKGCTLGNEGIVKLSEGLVYNQSLLGLNLRCNLFTKAVLSTLLAKLPKTIVMLDLSENKLSD